ncbi:P-type conjugative transfer protein TrbL [Xanthomonas perforans]|uniref:P-type conjugative transfer protein TrbL n=1 Tax=Xanthomonas perforans TaxID=442694 RepID=UPI00235843B7|nr:P-type conjugative transfer protein TrbL [Xanthomonas perforans]MDC9654347.1 P-type conjugative transfer protein TrbL [Xanthomonas perforans]MEB2158972.1 P-type conjugative transfer protein TrbL [Xanthomonas campestris pv. campestris]
MSKNIAVLFTALALFCLADSAFAQSADLQNPGASFDGLMQLVQQQASQWGPRLQSYASRLFWGLAVIQFTYSFFALVFKGADLGEILGELVRQILTIGFWFTFLKFSTDWMGRIVDSFRQAAGAAIGGDSALQPADMFALAVQFANSLVKSGSLLNPTLYTLIGISALIVLLCFAFIAILMALAIFESYIVINAGVLMMGFAGSSWTRDVTMQFVKYGVSVGAKLFVLTLLAGLIVSSAEAWSKAMVNDSASILTLAGLSFACAYFCKTIPDLIQGVIAGVSPGGGGAVGGMAAAGVAAAMAAGAFAKTIATGGAAAPLAAGSAMRAGSAMGSAAGLSGGSGMPSVSSTIGMEAGSSVAEGGAAEAGSSGLGGRLAHGNSEAAPVPGGNTGGDASADVPDQSSGSADGSESADDNDAESAFQEEAMSDADALAAAPEVDANGEASALLDGGDAVAGDLSTAGPGELGSSAADASGDQASLSAGDSSAPSSDTSAGATAQSPGGQSASGQHAAAPAAATDSAAAPESATSGAGGNNDAGPAKKSGPGRAASAMEAAAHAGKGVWANAAFVVPGVEASPSGAGLAPGGQVDPEKQPDSADFAPSAPQQPANVIRPETPSTSSGMGRLGGTSQIPSPPPAPPPPPKK